MKLKNIKDNPDVMIKYDLILFIYVTLIWCPISSLFFSVSYESHGSVLCEINAWTVLGPPTFERPMIFPIIDKSHVLILDILTMPLWPLLQCLQCVKNELAEKIKGFCKLFVFISCWYVGQNCLNPIQSRKQGEASPGVKQVRGQMQEVNHGVTLARQRLLTSSQTTMMTAWTSSCWRS